jgi:hypothetical protein
MEKKEKRKRGIIKKIPGIIKKKFMDETYREYFREATSLYNCRTIFKFFERENPAI